MAPDPLVASAFVQIAPEPKSVASFGSNLKTELDKQLKKSPVSVPVKVQLLAFKRDISTQLRNAGLTISVEPVLAPDFRKKVQTLATTALAGLQVTVPVGPVGGVGVGGGTGTSGGTGTGQGRGQGSTKAILDQRILRVTQAREVAELALARAQAEVADISERARLADVARSKVQRAINIADEESVALSKRKSTAAVTGAQEQVVAEQKLIDSLKKEVVAEKNAAKAAADKATADRQAAAAAESRTDRSAAAAALRGRLADVPSAGELASTPVTQARARLREAETIERTARSLAKQEAASRASLRTEGLLTIETAKRSAALQRELVVLEQSAAAEAVKQREAVKTALAEQKAGQAASERARRQEQALRGTGATALSRLGARGATLAAGGEFLAGAAIATAIGGAIDAAAEFETQLNVLQATVKATDTEMKAVSATALELGRDVTLPGVAANDAAQAITELGKAGLDLGDAMAAARGTLQLATAAEIDNAQATELVASGLNAFSLAGSDAIRVADLLTGASIEAQGSIADMGVALQQSAAVARQAGLSIEDTVALLTLLARNGLRGSDAGTSLRTSLIRLINPSKKAAAALDELGVRIRDADGNIRPEVYDELGQKLSQLSAKQRDATLALIFGQDAIRAAAIFAREGAEGLDAMRVATQKAGSTAEIAGSRTKGFAGDVEALKNEINTLGTTLGSLTLGPLSSFLRKMNLAIDVVTDFADAAQKVGQIKITDFLPAAPEVIKSGVSIGKVFNTAFEEGIGHFLLLQYLGPVGVWAAQGKRLAGAFAGGFESEVNTIIDDALSDLPGLVTNLQALGRKGGVSGIVESLREAKSEIQGSSEEAEKLRAEFDGLIRLVVALGRAPTSLELSVFLKEGSVPDKIKDIQDFANANPIQLPLNSVFAEREAKSAAEKSLEAFRDVLSPQAGEVLMDLFMIDWGDAATRGGKNAGDAAAKAFTLSFDAGLAVLEAEGASDSAILSFLRERLAKRQDFFNRLNAQQKAGKLPKSKEPLLEQAASNVTETQNQIESILNDQASARKEAADKITKARNEADQKFLDALGLEKGKLANAILRAGATTALQDDIKTHTALRNFLKKQIVEAGKTIKDATTRAQTVQTLTSELIQENQTIADLILQAADQMAAIFDLRVGIAQTTGNVSTLRKLFATRLRQLEKLLRDAIREAGKNSKLALELRDKINETRRAAFDAINESFELDIEFAETTGGDSGAVRAREAYIRQLQREQQFYKKGSLEWKRIRNEIANQRKAIAEARAESDRMFTELAFQFLTTQQGFFANVMGNLLPSGAIGGTVAGRLARGGGGGGGRGGGLAALTKLPGGLQFPGAPDPKAAGPGLPFGSSAGDPGAVLSEQSRVSTAESRGGFSASQAATVIALLRQMVALLGGIDTKGKHPEARRSQRTGAANGDMM